MRIPHIINQNTIAAYEIPSVYLRHQKIKPDFFTWDSTFIEKLSSLCLFVIAKNWEHNPLFDEVQVLADKLYLLELLSTDLPLKLTIPIIEHDYFWERCYKTRWPDACEPSKMYRYDKAVNIDDFHGESNESIMGMDNIMDTNEYGRYSDMPNAIRSAQYINIMDQRPIEEIGVDSSCYEKFNIPPSPNRVIIIKTWKQLYLERHAAEKLERMQPDLYSEDYIKDLTDLLGQYIISLKLKELQCRQRESSSDHIALHCLLPNLENLIEFSVCFVKGNQEDNFSWHSTKMSEADADLLGKGVEKSRIKILRVLKSDLNCRKAQLLARGLCNHATLLVLDLSFCKVGDAGARAIAGMLEQNSVLEQLILENNKIGSEGARALGYYLSEDKCRLVVLNLKLNPIGTEGGKHISTALSRGAKTLRSLNLSSCGLTPGNFAIGLMFSLNNTLQKLDLSNNFLGEECVNNMISGMSKNSTIIHLDLRMCAIDPEVVNALQQEVREHLEAYRGTLIRPPSAQSLL